MKFLYQLERVIRGRKTVSEWTRPCLSPHAESCQQRTLSRTQTLPLKVTKSVPALGSPSGVLALRLLKALRQFAQSHRHRFQTSVCAHQHSSKTAAESSSALQAMTRTRSRRLSFTSLIASRRTWMIASTTRIQNGSIQAENECARGLSDV